MSVFDDIKSIARGIGGTEGSILCKLEQMYEEQQRQTVLLQKIVDILDPPRAVQLLFLSDGKVITKMNLTDTQQSTATLAPVDAKGQPASVDGVPVWATDNDNVALTPAADGLSCLIVANKVGASNISVTADADLGEGVKTLSGSLAVVVTGGEATSLGITTSDPVEQPPAA